MRLLLDSHTVIWWVDQHQLLGREAHAALGDVSNELLVSAATIWEIGIKVGLAKLSLSMPFREWMSRAVSDLSAVILPITIEYADVQARLAGHHGDPFDRMLAAQAIVEQVAIVSNDSVFDSYGLQRLW